MTKTNEDVVVLSQGEAMDQNEESHAIIFHE